MNRVCKFWCAVLSVLIAGLIAAEIYFLRDYKIWLNLFWYGGLATGVLFVNVVAIWTSIGRDDIKNTDVVEAKELKPTETALNNNDHCNVGYYVYCKNIGNQNNKENKND